MKKAVMLFLVLSIFAFFWMFSCSVMPGGKGNNVISHGTDSRATSFNYADAFSKAIMFYEASWCGPDAGSNRLPWRAACHTSDGADVGLDLTGGFHDCGDHVKFGLTQVYSAATLGWAYYEYKDVFTAKGQDGYLLRILKHFTDYFLKCYPNATTFYYQCGEGNSDHIYWGPPELQTTAITPRPTQYVANTSTPASDVTATAAAALALMYMNYLDKDSAYANKCLTAAKSLYTFAKTYLGLSQSGGFYTSSGYWDDLCWGAVWLYTATTNSSYLNDVNTFLSNKNITDSSPYNNHWTHCWDDQWGGVFLKLSQITNRPLFKFIVEDNLSYWMTNVARTPAGFCYFNSWGNCRYVAAECMLALVYYKSTTNQAYLDFAKSQIDYILGNNPNGFSCEVGFGNNYPHFPHHRAASGRFEYPPANESSKDPERHLLYGALPGGPSDGSDNYVDDISQYASTEVGIDYNAGFVGALAGIVQLYGMSQTPEATPGIETNAQYYVTAYISEENNTHSTVMAYLNNISVLPPHYETNLSFRYFVNLSEYTNPTSAVTASLWWAPSNAVISALQPWDTANSVYYVELKATGMPMYGPIPFEFAVNAYSYSCWNPSNDYSRTGLTTSTNSVITTYIPVYRNGVLIFGNEPPKGGSSSSTASSTAVSSSRAASSIAASSSLAASSVASSAAVSSSRSSAASSTAVSSSRSSVASSTAVSSSRAASSAASSVASSVAVSSSRAASVASSVAASSSAASSGGYAVNYTVNNDWGAGATVTVTMKNNSASALSSWSLVWTYAGNQQITQIWSATQTTSGETVTAVNLSYNGTIGANGGTQSFGFNMSYSGSNAKPTAFTLNGTACTTY